MTERPISADEHTACAACGEPVSYTDEGGCVGTHPNAYHMRAECLLEAYRRASVGPPLTVGEWQWIERVARRIAGRYDDAEALPIANKIDAYLNPSDD
jgi:hypothetical protein